VTGNVFFRAFSKSGLEQEIIVALNISDGGPCFLPEGAMTFASPN